MPRFYLYSSHCFYFLDGIAPFNNISIPIITNVNSVVIIFTWSSACNVAGLFLWMRKSTQGQNHINIKLQNENSLVIETKKKEPDYSTVYYKSGLQFVA